MPTTATACVQLGRRGQETSCKGEGARLRCDGAEAEAPEKCSCTVHAQETLCEYLWVEGWEGTETQQQLEVPRRP